MPRDGRAQVAVIGSGPGGAVAASVLAEGGLDVLLIEEGSFLPLSSAPHFSREEILQKYRNAGINVALGRPKVAWVEGRCVGGGSEVNRGLYHRVSEGVLEAWRSLHRVDAMMPEDLAPHFEACEQVARISHLPGEAPAPSLKLREGAERFGWAWTEVPRLVEYSGTGDRGAPGKKQSMTETFLPRFLEAGGRLLPDTRVHRLSRSGGRWRLVLASPADAGRRLPEIMADAVFVACGAVQTPTLLRRSGFTRGIGDSLGFHPMIKVVARFPDEVQESTDLEPVHQIKEFDPRFSMGCSISKRPTLALALAARPDLLAEVDRDWRRMAIYYVQSTDGSASVRPVPWFRDPLVRTRRGSIDLGNLALGLRRLAECLFAAGAEAVIPGLPGVPLLRSPADLGSLPEILPAASGGITTMHLFGSCPMGEEPAFRATDSFGRIPGADGLHLVDASVLCGSPIVNPQGTVMAISHRNALRFLETFRRQARPLAQTRDATEG